MAAATDNVIVTTGTGTSDYLIIPRGKHLLQFTWAGAAGAGKLEISLNAVDFLTVLDSAGSDVSITANYMLLVAGGAYYRMNISSHTSVLTVTPVRSEYSY